MNARTEVMTVNDLGRMAGVSVTTVSRVLNNSGHVSAEKREAVLRAVRETDFFVTRARRGGRRGVIKHEQSDVVEIIQHRHSAVEAVQTRGGQLDVGPLRHPRSRQVARHSFGPENPFHRGIIDGAIEELARWDCRAQIRTNTDLLDPEFLTQLNGGGSAGVLLVGEASSDLAQFVHNCRRPLVLVDVMGSTQADLVTTDNWEGISVMFRHLYELGHRKIGFVGAKDRMTTTPDERFMAFKLHMHENKLPIREEWIYHGFDHIAAVTEAVAGILRRNERPTALLCQNDCCALGAMRAATQAGLAVPRDLSVAGFDDIDWASVMTPALTTMRVPVREMGRQGVRELMMQMKGGMPLREQACRVRMLPELIVRESTAAPPR